MLTGAGISAESGVPTFRGSGGLWKERRPEELATPAAFARDPRLVWEWYAWRRRIVAACRPNAAHCALARWVAAEPAGAVHLTTQNVDGLHGLAAAEVEVERRNAKVGRPRAGILELHGSLFRVRCTACTLRYEHRAPISIEAEAPLPTCRGCGSLLRPDVVWFGEPLDSAVLGAAAEAARDADLCLVVGTSAVVQPAAGLAALTLEAGGAIIEVNPEATPLTAKASVSLRGPATKVVPRLLPGAGGPEL